MKLTYVVLDDNEIVIKEGEVEKETESYYITAKNLNGKKRHAKEYVKKELGAGIDVTDVSILVNGLLDNQISKTKVEVEFYTERLKHYESLKEKYNGK